MQAKLHFYNTLGRKLEEFVPINPEKVTFYTCGPTVYDFAHIGNLRAFTFADTVKRTLIYFGYTVLHIMNVTDVGEMSDTEMGEDKILVGLKRERAKNKDITVWDIGHLYTERFIEDRDSMNILPPDKLTPATEHVPQMIELVKTLIEKGYAYVTKEAVYFDVSKFPSYTALSGQKLEDKREGVRDEVITDPNKKNPADFRVWQLDRPDHPMLWDSPWGKGFPGWHIECSAMSMTYLGESIDIHSGGMDHIPVHHPNEIAQSEAATGKKFVKYWLHNEFIRVDNVKMSKSLKNFYSMQDILEHGYDPLDLRYLYLEAHYRFPQNFTWESLKAAQSARKNLLEQVAMLKTQLYGREVIDISNHPLQEKFAAHLANDLNIPGALSILWETLRSKDLGLEIKYALLLDFDQVLGLQLADVKTIYEVFSESQIIEIKKLLQDRESAKMSKNWAAADEYRNRLTEMSVRIIDTPEGPLSLAL